MMIIVNNSVPLDAKSNTSFECLMAQSAFTCSTLTRETLEQGATYIQS